MSGVFESLPLLSGRPYTLLVMGLLAITSIPSRVFRLAATLRCSLGSTTAVVLLPDNPKDDDAHAVPPPQPLTIAPGMQALLTKAVDRSTQARRRHP